jgi:hypothetical protein
MNNIKFHIDGNITQNNLNGDNKIEVSGEINPTPDKAVSDKKTKKSSYLQQKWDVIKKNKKVFGYWLVVILLGIDVCCHISYNCVIENVNYLFAIIGILATFIVVGNYMQVKDIEGKFEAKNEEVKTVFESQIKGIEGKFEEERKKINEEFMSKADDFESDITEIKNRLNNAQTTMYSEIARNKGLVYESSGNLTKALSHYLDSIHYALDLSYMPPKSDFIRVQSAMPIDDIIRLSKNKNLSDIINEDSDIANLIEEIKNSKNYKVINDLFVNIKLINKNPQS